MYTFESDYTEGAHEKILQKLMETNYEQLPGYGNDHYCESAAEKIRSCCGKPEAKVHFLTGGTQSNAVVIRTMLRAYQGVVSAHTGHINCHEAGAVEYAGCKVLSLPATDGKLQAEDLRQLLVRFYEDGSHDHMVFPGMVYISHPTEYGTLYSKQELKEIYGICKEYEMPLFVDGARLGYGIMSYHTDVTMEDLANLCDVFYIGGTKVGALCGEAVVFTNPAFYPEHFVTMVKQHGAMVAKGRLHGIQFDVLFTDGLYFEIARHGIDMAEKLKKLFCDKGYQLYLDSPTNQQFVILDHDTIARLEKSVGFSVWEDYDADHKVVRFATSWATTEESLKELEQLL